MNKKGILILVAAVVAAVGATATVFLLFLKPAPATDPAQTVEAPAEPAGILRMEPFLVNINDPAGDRFAKLALSVTVRPGAAVERLNDDDVLQAKMRDRILTLLTSKTTQELTGPVGKEGLRREIKAHIEPLIDEAEIEEILFAEFVVQ